MAAARSGRNANTYAAAAGGALLTAKLTREKITLRHNTSVLFSHSAHELNSLNTSRPVLRRARDRAYDSDPLDRKFLSPKASS